MALIGLRFLSVDFPFGEIGEAFDRHTGDGTGPFNGKVLAVAVTAFGSTGLLATSLGAAALPSALIAAASVLSFGAAAWWLIAFFYRQQATTAFSLRDLDGRIADVTVAVPPDGSAPSWSAIPPVAVKFSLVARRKAPSPPVMLSAASRSSERLRSSNRTKRPCSRHGLGGTP